MSTSNLSSVRIILYNIVVTFGTFDLIKILPIDMWRRTVSASQSTPLLSCWSVFPSTLSNIAHYCRRISITANIAHYCIGRYTALRISLSNIYRRFLLDSRILFYVNRCRYSANLPSAAPRSNILSQSHG